jgi:hypothetical protein
MRDLVHKLLLFLFFLNCLSAPKKIELPEEKPIVDKEEFTPTPARVIAKPILNLKESPDLNSKIIDSIPENYIVFATEKTNEKETIAGHEDYWYKAQFKNKTGWLFGKFDTLFCHKFGKWQRVESLCTYSCSGKRYITLWFWKFRRARNV